MITDSLTEGTGGFAAGTLVHTKEGLRPIEEIRVGDWVLSYPDDQKRPRRIRAADEYAYKRVTQTFVTEDQSLSKLIVSNLATGDRETLLVAPGHPIYNADRGWIPLVEMDAGDVLENFIFGNLLVYRVYHDVGRGCVYNFEVEDFHSYYVGEQGVWVHNTNGGAEEAADLAFRKLDRDASRPTGFPMDTLVATEACQWCEIDLLDVGSWVLSRCEKTGEQAYRRVTKKYEHWTEGRHGPEFPLYRVSFVAEGGRQSVIDATAEHPFWVNGVGWVNASDLKSGQKMEICDPLAMDDRSPSRPNGQKSYDLRFSGQRWQAEVVSVLQKGSAGMVYDIEVEDFHTYFVGGFGVWVRDSIEFICLSEIDSSEGAELGKPREPSKYPSVNPQNPDGNI